MAIMCTLKQLLVAVISQSLFCVKMYPEVNLSFSGIRKQEWMQQSISLSIYIWHVSVGRWRSMVDLKKCQTIFCTVLSIITVWWIAFCQTLRPELCVHQRIFSLSHYVQNEDMPLHVPGSSEGLTCSQSSQPSASQVNHILAFSRSLPYFRGTWNSLIATAAAINSREPPAFISVGLTGWGLRMDWNNKPSNRGIVRQKMSWHQYSKNEGISQCFM